MRRALLALVLLAAPLHAAEAACSVSAQPTAFGNYNPLSVLSTDAVGQVSVTCSFVVAILTTYTIKLSTGGGSYATRRLSSGGNTLNYNLYTDLLRTTVWGDGSAGTGTVSNTQLIGIGGFTGNHAVYGRVPAQQNAVSGSYSDTITVTVDY